ncbi:9584_t:CDS:10 [Acaulospora morrowiae]|uniref:RNA helicase n=1 Tax=Acaulospora morrowiae TaxID=94023 RepID=A0A9N9A5D0_9GLOM|nr:9584_t:CDS:10 [Acaulospora morrowiae]
MSAEERSNFSNKISAVKQDNPSPKNENKKKDKRDRRSNHKKNKASVRIREKGSQHFVSSTVSEEKSLTNPTKSKKRKISASGQEDIVERRNRKNDFLGINDLDWSEVQVPESTFVADEENLSGFLCLEEVDNVHVEYEETATKGNTIKFKKVHSDQYPSKRIKNNASAKPEEPLPASESLKYYDLDNFDEKNLKNSTIPGDSESRSNPQSTENSEQEENDVPQIEVDQASNTIEKKYQDNKHINITMESASKEPEKVNIDAWEKFNLSSDILDGLRSLNFSAPTPIQENALPFGLSGRDVVGTAETGSGKTLAFGIPILDYIIKNRGSNVKGQLTGLILTPTRELAIQIKEHLINMSKSGAIKIIAVVGGMAIQKQKRLLAKLPNIIVATPGRLWELLSENDDYLQNIRHIKHLVLDEADRMLETGHFKELNHILTVLSQSRQNTSDWNEDKIITENLQGPSRQTFIFSATLDSSLKENLKRRNNKPRKVESESKGTMAELMQRLEFNDPDPVFIDITPKESVVETLQESKIECLTKDKDLYAYYFITRYPGRTLIFVNSIDAIRRLVPIMKLLNIEVYGLHAQMQQRQRLKNLDRFKQNPKAVMVASDVAARGLDIPLVEHVIHYQLPHSGDIYVHRSGRTARARREGISLMLCSPEELSLYRKILGKLKKVDDIPNFPIDAGIINSMKQRINLAKQIDQEEHKLQKSSHDDGWLKKAAEEFGVELHEDLLKIKDGGDNEGLRNNQHNKKDRIRSLKAQLKELLSQQLIPRGVSTKYLTSGIVRDLADRLLDEPSHNSQIMGVKKTKATEDLKSKSTKKRKKFSI